MQRPTNNGWYMQHGKPMHYNFFQQNFPDQMVRLWCGEDDYSFCPICRFRCFSTRSICCTSTNCLTQLCVCASSIVARYETNRGACLLSEQRHLSYISDYVAEPTLALHCQRTAMCPWQLIQNRPIGELHWVCEVCEKKKSPTTAYNKGRIWCWLIKNQRIIQRIHESTLYGPHLVRFVGRRCSNENRKDEHPVNVEDKHPITLYLDRISRIIKWWSLIQQSWLIDAYVRQSLAIIRCTNVVVGGRNYDINAVIWSNKNKILLHAWLR